MNRAIVIVVVPALLVAVGYVVVLRGLGLTPGTWPLLVLGIIAAAAIWRAAGRARARHN